MAEIHFIISFINEELSYVLYNLLAFAPESNYKLNGFICPGKEKCNRYGSGHINMYHRPQMKTRMTPS